VSYRGRGCSSAVPAAL